MTNRIADREANPAPEARHIRPRATWVLVALALVAAGVIVPRIVRPSPTTVDHITIVNNSPYDLNVDLTGAHRDGRLAIGAATNRSSTQFEHIIDQGDLWILHFTAQGQDGGEMQIGRAALARADWRIVVPDTVVERLRTAGAPPSPSTDEASPTTN